MNLPAPLHTNRVGHAYSDALVDGARLSVAQLHDGADEGDAHNGRPDPKVRIEPAESDDFRSPLWAVAIGTGCVLAAMAVVIALG
jgi:hypothetical protein